jgi:hypothetical protein
MNVESEKLVETEQDLYGRRNVAEAELREVVESHRVARGGGCQNRELTVKSSTRTVLNILKNGAVRIEAPRG